MERKYYIAQGKEHLGPFSISELQEKKISPDTLIWYEGLEQWTKASEITELKSCIVSIPLPPPTPSQIEFQTNNKSKFIKIAHKGLTIIFWIAFTYFAYDYLFIFVPFLKKNDTLDFPHLLGGMFGFAIVLSIIWIVRNKLNIEKKSKEDKDKSKIVVQIQKKLLSNAGWKTFELFIGFLTCGVILVELLKIDVIHNFIFKNYSDYYSPERAKEMESTINDFQSHLFLSSFILLIIISVCFFVIYYIIEKQKPYQGLLKFDDVYYKKENDSLLKIVEEQRDKYFFSTNLSLVMPIIGYIILFINIFIGFFPEIRFSIYPDYMNFFNSETIPALIGLFELSRIVCCVIVSVSAYNKMRNYLFWGIFSLFFPSIGMITMGSLYPMNHKDIICPECGKQKSRGNLYCDECLQKHEPKIDKGNDDDW